MIDLVFVLVILLILANGSFLASVAMVPGIRGWYREHYRWYAAFTVLTALVAVLVALQGIVSS